MMRLFIPGFLLSAGCEPSKGYECGPGTHAEGDQCVPDESGGDGGGDSGEPSGGDDSGGAEGGGSEGGGSEGGGSEGGGGEGGGDDTGGGGTTSYDVCGSGAPYTSLQDAIDAASDGDTLTVCAGTYGPVQVGAWSPSELTLVGADGATDTVIDGGEETAWLQSGGSYTLSGFTFTGSLADSEGAIHVTDGTFALSQGIVTGVTANDENIYDYQHAIYVNGAETVELDDVMVEDNDFGSGYAVTVAVTSTATLRHLVIANNTGLSLTLSGDLVELSNSLVYGNEASSPLHVYFNGTEGSAWVHNNVFANNTHDHHNPEWYSYTVIRGEVDLQNNVFYGNDGYMYYESGGFDYNCVYGDSAVCDGCTGTGNLISDPKFNDPSAGDFTLNAGFSPLVDAGNPLAGYNDVDGTRNDIGAYGGPHGDW